MVIYPVVYLIDQEEAFIVQYSNLKVSEQSGI